MAKDKIKLTASEEKSPDVIKRLIRKYRQNYGVNAKRNINRSRKWFQTNASKSAVRTSELFRSSNDWKQRSRGSQVTIGKMYFFQYNAELKNELPYWDKFPLIFPFDFFSKNGNKYMMGINLHYIPPAARLVVFNELIKLRDERRFRQSTKLRMTYEKLKGLAAHRLIKPCVKMYFLDTKHILSNLVEVPADDWEIALFLPVARFQGASNAEVYADSATIAKGK